MPDKAQVTMNLVQTVTVPGNMIDLLTGSVGILGGIENMSPPYRSGAIVFGPAFQAYEGSAAQMVMGILSYSALTQEYGLVQPTQGQDDTGWPSTDSFSAACGVSGGYAAFAKLNGTGDAPTVQVHGANPADSAGWGLQYTIRIPRPGTVQCMLERAGMLYGFIKGQTAADNSFFMTPSLGNSTVRTVSYQGKAAASSFPIATNMDRLSSFMFGTIAFDNDKIIAIDESSGGVLCAALDGSSVTSYPLGENPTIGLVIDEKFNKGYGTFLDSITTDQNIMPYTIDAKGAPKQGQEILGAQIGCCPAIDQILHLLYLPGGGRADFYVYDVETDTKATVSGGPASGNFGAGYIGSWVSAGADSTHSIFYTTGRTATDQTLCGSILVYECSVTRS